MLPSSNTVEDGSVENCDQISVPNFNMTVITFMSDCSLGLVFGVHLQGFHDLDNRRVCGKNRQC